MNPLRTHPLLAPEDGGGPGESPAARRTGSMSLRDNAGRARGDDSPLDPANQSLADSLRVMLGILQLGMFVLAGWYCLSGLNKVEEGTQGIRLLFGQKQGEALDPGLHLSAPYPLGDLIAIELGWDDAMRDASVAEFLDECAREDAAARVDESEYIASTGSSRGH
jgi:hypothetical protein